MLLQDLKTSSSSSVHLLALTFSVLFRLADSACAHIHLERRNTTFGNLGSLSVRNPAARLTQQRLGPAAHLVLDALLAEFVTEFGFTKKPGWARC